MAHKANANACSADRGREEASRTEIDLQNAVAQYRQEREASLAGGGCQKYQERPIGSEGNSRGFKVTIEIMS